MPGPTEGYRPLCSCRGGCVLCEVDGMPLDTDDHWLMSRPPEPPAFAAELRRAMAARGVTGAALGAMVGVTESRISNLVRGQVARPLPSTAERLARALAWPRLATLAVELRRTACRVCKRPIAETARRRRRYCSRQCKHLAKYRREHEGRRNLEVLARGRLAAYQDAVDAFCRQCAAGSVCRVAECPLRAVSPLTLAPEVSLPARGC